MTQISDCNNFQIRLYRPQHVLNASQCAGNRAWTGATSTLVVNTQPVAFKAKYMEIASIALEIGTNLLVEHFVDQIKPLLVLRT
jgi:hypothetical protein